MLKLIFIAVVIAILRTPGAVGQEGQEGSGVLAQGDNGTLGDEIERGDGTLPLRLPGDGTLPLKLRGRSVQGTNNLSTQITLTSAQQQALSGGAAAGLNCRLTGVNLSKHAATGTVMVGLATYEVKGICYNHDTREMEVVSVRANGTEHSFMAGGLESDQPTQFEGQLTITGSNAAGHYDFDLRSVEEHL